MYGVARVVRMGLEEIEVGLIKVCRGSDHVMVKACRYYSIR